MITSLHKEFIAELNADDNFMRTVKNLRQAGTIIAFEISSGKDDYLNTISGDITRKGLAHGIFLRPLGNTIYLMPPYCINRDELIKVYSFLKEIIQSADTLSQ
jgi:adenosylmethionine-8-amino-7-oxononanoate aminotransferase